MNLIGSAVWTWAARYSTWLLIKLTPKGSLSFPFLSFPFLSFPFLFSAVWWYKERRGGHSMKQPGVEGAGPVSVQSLQKLWHH